MDPNYLDFEQPIADLEAKISELRLVGSDSDLDINEEIQNLQNKSTRLTEKNIRQSVIVADFASGPSSAAALYAGLYSSHLR